MATRISGIELKDNWKVDYALTNIKGIGWSSSNKILDHLKIEKSKRVSDLTTDDVSKITSEIEGYSIEGDLLRQVRENVSRLKQIGSYRGIRHSRALPVRGQRTKTNARTKRGKRKTVGAFKKKTLLQNRNKQKNNMAAKKKLESGKVYISASFNNTLVTITDDEGNTLVWGSAGASGFKGTRKATPFAATTAVEKVVKVVKDQYGMKEAEIYLKGPGPGRDAALRAVRSAGLRISMIADITPLPHNGPRPKKKRRV